MLHTAHKQWQIWKPFVGGRPMASTLSASLVVVWGRAPSGVKEQSPWWGSGGFAPEADSIFVK